MIDRFQTCLGYYWYALEAYYDYRDQYEILARLRAIGFKPGDLSESSDSADPEEDWYALEVYASLLENGYNGRWRGAETA
jgi:hypothetical protein